jgi:hypothetical protein
VTRSGVQVTILHLTLGLLGCGAWSGDPPVELAAATRDSAGVRILELSHTLNAVAAGASNAIRIEHDLVVGHGEEEWFGTVADVEGLGGGGFAVRDERERVVRVFDSQGRRVATLGRPGMGPVSFGSRGP